MTGTLSELKVDSGSYEELLEIEDWKKEAKLLQDEQTTLSM